MQKLSIALLFVASAAAAQRAVPDPGFARLPGRPLRIVDSTRIDTRAAKIETPLYLFSAPKGGVVVYSQWRAVTAFDSLGRRQWSQGTGQEDRREVGEITAFGWKGNEMWVSDAAWTQIALLDQYGNVTKSLELPSWVRPTFSNRKSFPVFESMRVFGRYEDGTMLVMPRNSMSITGATSYDETASYLLRINEDGIIQRTVAKFPSSSVTVKLDDGNKLVFQNPLNQWLFRVSPDGMRTIVVSVDTTAPKMDTVVVRALNDRGDTVYVQKFGYPAMTYTDVQVDSIARLRWGSDTDYRERRAKAMPRRAAAVWDIALDVDKSVWLTLRGNATTRSVVGFDPAGKVIGKFQLPARRSVKAANMGSLWIAEIRSDVRGDIVRYRVR